MADFNLSEPQTKGKQLLVLFFLVLALFFFNLVHLSSYVFDLSNHNQQDWTNISQQVIFLSPDGLIKQGRGDEPQAPRLSFFLNQPMDINRATANELELISGIGPKTAERIIKYRNELGKFYDINELDNIHGIGPGTIRKISGYVSFCQ